MNKSQNTRQNRAARRAQQRKEKGKRLAVIASAVALSAALTLGATAITPTYDGMTDSFRGSRYYLNLETLTLRGDGATDIVMVAMSQLGYHEGNCDGECNGENDCGTGNYTEYNHYHGCVDQLGDGVLTYGYPWCASFVSYCARLAGISQRELPTSLNCTSWIQMFRNLGVYHTRASGYVPKQGDLIFFRDASSTRASTHVGLVRYECNGLVYTVEGNCGDEVRLAAYNMKDTYIVGYASPRYEKNKSEAIDYLLHEYTQGNYIIAAVDLPVRKSPSYGSAVTFTLHRGDLMHIYECKNNWGRTDYGWIPMTDTQPIDVKQ